MNYMPLLKMFGGNGWGRDMRGYRRGREFHEDMGGMMGHFGFDRDMRHERMDREALTA